MPRQPSLMLDPRPWADRPPRECACGCGGMTKGGRYLSGHNWQSRAPGTVLRRWDGPAFLTATDPEERDAARLAAETAALDEDS